ncbi:MAG: hypothetical protein J6B71_07715, partial [Clostridia bacterium]|nr:hypothetical protein [Clostridia bacterium]
TYYYTTFSPPCKYDKRAQNLRLGLFVSNLEAPRMRCFFHSLVTHPLIFPPKTRCVLDKGSHFASKATGARSQEPRAKIFAIGEIPELANARVRIPHPKIDKLACRA